MINKQMLNIKWIVFSLGLVCFIIFVAIANEARKEVYYLCNNFSQGNSIASIKRQLNTASWSAYSIEENGSEQQVTFSSPLNFHYFRCIILISSDNTVSSVIYE